MTAHQCEIVVLEQMPLLRITAEQCVDRMIQSVLDGEGCHLITVNVDILRRHTTSPEYRRMIGHDFEAVADGMPLVWVSRLLGRPLPERVAGSDLLQSLTDAAASNRMTVLLLGGQNDAGALAADRLRSARADVDVHWRPLPNPFTFTEAEVSDAGDEVRALKPSIVFISLGSPKGEQLVAALRTAAPSACWISVGAGFDFLAGTKRRAPRLFRLLGLEWLFRLASEPRRLAKRYLVDDLPFAALMSLRAVRNRRLS